MSTVKALINSMRLRTLPLSLAGVVCGGFLAMGRYDGNGWVFILVLLTACSLQVLSNLSNELGDYRSGVDGEGREGPNYSLASGGLTEKQLSNAVKGAAVVSAVVGLAMLLLSFPLPECGFQFFALVLLGAASIWASTHYTLGKNPYGYRGWGDLFVFIFFGIVSVMGSYFVVAHRIDFEWLLILPAIGVGLLSVAVLNVNNIRDMESDRGKRVTIPLKIGARRAKWYQTFLIIVGALCMLPLPVLPFFGFLFLLPVAGLVLHLMLVWQAEGRKLDSALPILVISTFLLAFVYGLIFK